MLSDAVTNVPSSLENVERTRIGILACMAISTARGCITLAPLWAILQISVKLTRCNGLASSTIRGSAVNIPLTSVKISTISAFSATPRAVADVSLPPRPSVVNSS